jgi:hypothetical protein
MPIVRSHERPFTNLRPLPGDYSLATFAGCGRLFSHRDQGTPGQPGQGRPWN